MNTKEIKEIAKTELILKVLYFVAWIIFIGVSIEAGGFISNTFFTLVINPGGAAHFWNQLDLSSLYAHDPGHFFAQTFLMSIAAFMKAMLFYLIIRILHGNKFDVSQPFTKGVARFIFTASYLAYGIGFFSFWGVGYANWLVEQGVTMPAIQDLRLAGGDVWMFMGVILFVIGQIFKRGIEIQSENELTV
jgi:hypothetical protein